MDVRRSAIIIALVVGPIISIINHGEKICAATMTFDDWLIFGMTIVVPYSISI